ncbi:ChrB domain-containing protein [Arthrobacter terricola]|uniref:ChrB domain-containing protein n=1 Tax=Arthrobacter terricola TaxID=2547396 RepID=A0A4R5KFG3_9MICC|nr:ChrB domain-containing protein [Arthrobacter terricola]
MAAVAPERQAAKAQGSPTWLLLVYRVPSEPTRLRAAVWRKLRNLGAIYMQNSAAAVPRTAASERAMRALRNEIVESMSGKAFLINSTSIIGETDLVEMFNEARNEEYEEILDKCRDFHAGVEKEVREEHFTYGELEENEEDLVKLKGWYQKVKARDMLGASLADKVSDALADCASTLEEFAARVYEADSAAL